MALSQNALQKKRTKKNTKRNDKRPTGGRLGALLGFSRDWAAASRAPVVDVLAPCNLFELGMGHVWFSRRLPDGRYAMAGFLVDTFCLGVKNAFYNIMETRQYREALERIFGSTQEGHEQQHPAYARKLVEGAVAYARDLGFDPHFDYRIAKAIFGDVDAAACPVKFVFGQDDKPFYVSGPHDSPSMQRRIVTQLERRCGTDGFHFMISATSEGLD
ncbi:MAG: hypothetical protein ACREXY_12790 [Gammaproteobacteria bacterium]